MKKIKKVSLNEIEIGCEFLPESVWEYLTLQEKIGAVSKSLINQQEEIKQEHAQIILAANKAQKDLSTLAYIIREITDSLNNQVGHLRLNDNILKKVGVKSRCSVLEYKEMLKDKDKKTIVSYAKSIFDAYSLNPKKEVFEPIELCVDLDRIESEVKATRIRLLTTSQMHNAPMAGAVRSLMEKDIQKEDGRVEPRILTELDWYFMKNKINYNYKCYALIGDISGFYQMKFNNLIEKINEISFSKINKWINDFIVNSNNALKNSLKNKKELISAKNNESKENNCDLIIPFTVLIDDWIQEDGLYALEGTIENNDKLKVRANFIQSYGTKMDRPSNEWIFSFLLKKEIKCKSVGEIYINKNNLIFDELLTKVDYFLLTRLIKKDENNINIKKEMRI